MIGAEGVAGCALISAEAEATEVQVPLVTVNVYEPAASPEKLAVVVEPVMVAPPGVAVTVQAEAGRPLKATEPVATAQVGCVIAPIIGAEGAPGAGFTIALAEATEVQPPLVTVNVYVLAAKPEKLAVGVAPVMVAPPGVAVTVHAEAGNPLNATVPVGVAQVGCVIAPITGAEGVAG